MDHLEDILNQMESPEVAAPRGTTLALPTGLEMQLAELIQLLKDQNPKDGEEELKQKQADSVRYSVVVIPAATGRTNFHVQLGRATYRMQFDNIDSRYRCLRVKLNDPDAPYLNVLCAGGVIESSDPITQFWLTTITASGQVSALADLRILLGNVSMPGRPLTDSQLCDTRDLFDIGGSNALGADFPGSGDPFRFETYHGTVTATGETDIALDLENDTRYRLTGSVAVLKPSAGADIGHFRIEIQQQGGAVVNSVPLDVVVGETGSLFYEWRTPWLHSSVDHDLVFNLIALGPASNEYHVTARIEMRPVVGRRGGAD